MNVTKLFRISEYLDVKYSNQFTRRHRSRKKNDFATVYFLCLCQNYSGNQTKYEMRLAK